MRFAPTLTNMRQHPETISFRTTLKNKSSFLFHRKSHPLVNLKLMCYFCRINKQNFKSIRLCAYLEQR